MTAEASTRAELIRRIEATYPPDSSDADRARIGTAMMLQLLEATTVSCAARFRDNRAWLDECDPVINEHLRVNWRQMLPFEILLVMAKTMESEEDVLNFMMYRSALTNPLVH